MQKTSTEMISHEEEVDLRLRRAMERSPSFGSGTVSTISTPPLGESLVDLPLMQDNGHVSPVLNTTTACSSAGNKRHGSPCSFCEPFSARDGGVVDDAQGDKVQKNRSTPKRKRAARDPENNSLGPDRDECWADVFSLSPY